MTILSCRRTGVSPVSDSDVHLGCPCESASHVRKRKSGAHAPRVPYSAFRRKHLMPLRSNPTLSHNVSSLLKVIKGCSRLLKQFFKKYFFATSFCQPWPTTHGVGHPAGKGSLKKAKVGKSRVFSKIKDCLIPFQVLPSDLLASEFGLHFGRLRSATEDPPGGVHKLHLSTFPFYHSPIKTKLMP
jgi:hypothetical protein